MSALIDTLEAAIDYRFAVSGLEVWGVVLLVGGAVVLAGGFGTRKQFQAVELHCSV